MKTYSKAIRRRVSEPFRMKYALSNQERRALVKELNVNCLVLFEYYLRLASMENADFSDALAAEYFSWQEPTAQRWRLALVKAGWVHFEKATMSSGNKMQMVYLGKAEVKEALGEL